MIIRVRLTPNATRDEILGRLPDGTWRVKVQPPPVEGAANRRLVAFLAESAGVAKSKVRIIRGETSRIKTVEIEGGEADIIHRLETRIR